MIVTVTGHRPSKLPCKYDQTHPWYKQLQVRTEQFMFDQDDSLIIRTGMALGFDQLVAKVCIALGIEFYCFIPCYGQFSIWPRRSQMTYHEILEVCRERYDSDHIIMCSEKSYRADPGCMNKRNSYMLEGFLNAIDINASVPCDALLALWNGDTFGGTYDTIQKAQKLNLEITNLWE